MQRVRIGLTGLALVFVLVLLSAVIRSASDDEQPVMNGAGPTAGAQQSNGLEGASDPLAELGVAPGSVESDNASSPAPAK